MTLTTPAPVPALDARLAAVRDAPGRTWGVPDALLGLLCVPASLLLGGLLVLVVDLPDGALVALASLVLCALAALAVRRPARQSGGAGAALGFGLPRWSDAPAVLGWSLLLFVAQAAVGVLVGLLVPALRGVPADNTSFLRGAPVGELLLLAFAAVVVAPVVEELLFRGLLLQGLMLRVGFWPAAVVSSVFFGVLHTGSLDAGRCRPRARHRDDGARPVRSGPPHRPARPGHRRARAAQRRGPVGGRPRLTGLRGCPRGLSPLGRTSRHGAGTGRRRPAREHLVKIGIIGAGNIGGNLTRRLTALGPRRQRRELARAGDARRPRRGDRRARRRRDARRRRARRSSS